MSRAKLIAAQVRLQKKNAAIATGTATGGPGMPLVFVVQLAPLIRRVLTEPGYQETLAKAVISAIEATERVVLAPESSPEDRNEASQTLIWLYGVTVRSQVSLAQSTTRAELARVRRARQETKKARALADREAVVLTVAKERGKIDRKLRRAQKEIAAQAVSTGD